MTEDDLRGVADEKKLPIERVRDIMYPGLTVKLTTADNADMTVSYGTSEDVKVEDQTHTGAEVHIAAYGPRAANVVGRGDRAGACHRRCRADPHRRRMHGARRPSLLSQRHRRPWVQRLGRCGVV